jgi:hypothetical protein
MFIYEKCKMEIWRHFQILEQLRHIMSKLTAIIVLLDNNIIQT